ncbi:hypothetical protein D3C81_1643110 [compost metagenome]
MQRAVQQRAGGAVDGLTAVDGIGHVDKTCIDQVAVVHIDSQAKPLSDCVGQLLPGVGLQVGKRFKQPAHLCRVVAVARMLVTPGFGDVRHLQDCRGQPGRGLLPVAHWAQGVGGSCFQPGRDFLLDGGVRGT